MSILLHLSTNNQTKQPIQTQKQVNPNVVKYSYSTYLKAYLQSLMKWTFEQNPEFAEYLQEDELATWYIHNMKHPKWFIYEFKKNPFKLVSDMTDYIRYYKDSASTYKILINVSCKIPEVNSHV